MRVKGDTPVGLSVPAVTACRLQRQAWHSGHSYVRFSYPPLGGFDADQPFRFAALAADRVLDEPHGTCLVSFIRISGRFFQCGHTSTRLLP